MAISLERSIDGAGSPLLEIFANRHVERPRRVRRLHDHGLLLSRRSGCEWRRRRRATAGQFFSARRSVNGIGARMTSKRSKLAVGFPVFNRMPFAQRRLGPPVGNVRLPAVAAG